MRSILALLLCLTFPLAANAVSGSWTQKSAGGLVSVGQQILTSHSLVPSAGISSKAKVISISWKISLLAPPPPGLEIKLCSSQHCIKLPSLSGHKNIKVHLQAYDTYRFIYSVNSLGQLRPALNVVSNQLTINYRG